MMRYVAEAWGLGRLSAGHRTRAIRLIADRHWHLGNKLKGSKDVDAAFGGTVCQVCVEGHESQFNWVCKCNRTALSGDQQNHLYQDLRVAKCGHSKANGHWAAGDRDAQIR